MGLDMYAWVASRDAFTNPDAPVDLEFKPDAPRKELAYWRKFNALHGWMENLYRSKGGTDASFNCNTVRLDPADLDALEHALNNNELKPVRGFFFGAQEIHPEDVEATRKFILAARAAIRNGLVVVYDSWW